MKKLNKKLIYIIFIIILVIVGIVIGTIRLLEDKNKLSVSEKEWIVANNNIVQNLYVINDVDVFGKNGSGVFFDYIDSMKKEYNLEMNPITYNGGEQPGDRAFKVVNKLGKDQVLFYTEHYVLISKEKKIVNSINDVGTSKVGITKSDEDSFKNYLGSKELQVVSYETITQLLQALDAGTDVQYAVIPLEENLSSLLTSSYVIDYHISDYNKYFVYQKIQDDVLSNIIEKYYYKYKDKELSESINSNELKTFVTALSITDKDLKSIQSKRYNYGFINHSPYEVLTSGSYGGIVSEYISMFSKFSDTDFLFTRYKTYNKLLDAINNKKIDMFFNYYQMDTKFNVVDSLEYINYVVVAPEKNDLVINSISGIGKKTVYVLKNSKLEKYLEGLGIKTKTYETPSDLKKIIRKENIIVLDKLSFDYYSNNIMSNYNSRFEGRIDDTYNFYISNDNELLRLLFNKYVSILDPREMKVKGLYNHSVTIESGTLIGNIARYSLVILLAIIIIVFMVYKSTKRIKIAKKIKKVDKIKYIDQLTSLKNRNYLNDNLSSWNKNTIYPQATIVLDLNRLQEINDTDGYEKGDKQIKAAANVLVRTQLDNSDIIRTDGNEFLLYLVGYSEKQVASYIRKLNKEFKKLPYDYGVAIGYSMLLNDAKTLEDAINESVEDMKNKKSEIEESKNA